MRSAQEKGLLRSLQTQLRFTFRLLADLLVGLAAAAGFIVASHHEPGVEALAVVLILVAAAGLAGHLEPSAKRVWIHPLVIMSPELLVLPVAVLTCKGFECAGLIAFLTVASLFAFVLIGVSFAAFFVRRWMSPPAGSA